MIAKLCIGKANSFFILIRDKIVKIKLFIGIISLLTFSASIAYADSDYSKQDCPADVLNSTSPYKIRLTQKWKHFKVKWNDPDDPTDNVYQVCRDKWLSKCKDTGFTSSNSTDLVIIGNGLRNIIRGGDFNDTICGMGGNDYIKAGNGNDIVYGNNGRDVLIGGNGNDTIYGGNGADIIYGLDEDHENFDFLDEFDDLPFDADILHGGRGKDWIAGGPKNDTIYGEAKNDYINGGEGLDTIDGGVGDDNCVDVDDQSGRNDEGATVDECAASESVDPL